MLLVLIGQPVTPARGTLKTRGVLALLLLRGSGKWR